MDGLNANLVPAFLPPFSLLQNGNVNGAGQLVGVKQVTRGEARLARPWALGRTTGLSIVVPGTQARRGSRRHPQRRDGIRPGWLWD